MNGPISGMNSTGIIILAAGSSSRFGSIKQLLFYKGKSLLEHVCDEALNARLYPVVVIVGANADMLIKVFHPPGIEIVNNEKWQEGMGSGIFAGVSKIFSMNIAVENIIIAVCDQPFVSSKLFQRLIEKKSKTGKGIVASAYAGTKGTPVLFNRKYCKDLLALTGEEGAKKILKLYDDDVAVVDFPQGEIDIDTPANYAALKKR